MKLLGCALAVAMGLTVLGGPLRAQGFEMLDAGLLDTRFGHVVVAGGELGPVDQVVMLGGVPLVPRAERYSIRGAFGRAEEVHDWVIVSSHHTGNLCGGFQEFFVLKVSAETAQVSQPLNACVPILDVRVEAGHIEIDMGHADLQIAREVIRWDGVQMTSALVPEAAAQVPGAGPQVMRWLGASAAAIFQDAGERARFAQVMPQDALQRLAGAVSLANAVERRGDWVLGRGCQQHACNAVRGLWGIRVSDGAVAATIFTAGSGMTGYGLAGDPVFAAAAQDLWP